MEISRLESVDVRTIWKKEERDFTPWLADNIDLLSEKLNIELSFMEKEKPTGTFETDILAEDSESNLVIIENQFGKSDHDHLGKTLTYLANIEAKTAIWICEDPRPEHIKVIDWLNELPDLSFYLVKIEAYKISNSPPAPHFVLVTGPSVSAKEVGAKKIELAERHLKRLDFWEKLLEKSIKMTPLFSNIKPKKDNWIETNAGIAGIRYVYVILMDSARIELYIDTGEQEKNKNIFDKLYSEKDKIESELGEPIDWQRLELKRACRIWDQLQEEMINKMIKFERVMKKRIDRIR